jgi:cardiolipin synthase
VGSTNLNVASWIGNRELDVVVEDEAFARRMEEQYVEDLKGSTEIVLSKRRWVREAGEVRRPRTRGAGGSAGRAAAGALRLGNALGAVLSPRRVHSPIQRRLMVPAGLVLVSLAPIAAVWPRALAWPLGIFALWIGIALLIRAAKTPGQPS